MSEDSTGMAALIISILALMVSVVSATAAVVSAGNARKSTRLAERNVTLSEQEATRADARIHVSVTWMAPIRSLWMTVKNDGRRATTIHSAAFRFRCPSGAKSIEVPATLPWENNQLSGTMMFPAEIPPDGQIQLKAQVGSVAWESELGVSELINASVRYGANGQSVAEISSY